EEEEDYAFEYSEEEEDETDVQVDLENSYYTAKGMKADQPQEAVEAFRKVMEMEEDKGLWGFKALKQIMKILFKLKEYKEFSECYTQLLGYTSGRVTQNVGERGVNSILDYVSSSNDWELLERLYEKTLETLREHKNDRLWFKCNLKLGHLMYELGDMGRLQRIIKELLRSCEAEGSVVEDNGADTVKRGTQLLEVFALQILMHSRTKDKKKLREVYTRALRITSAVPHPRTLATILNCGGKMHMEEREWEQACTAFFQSFKSYDEAGDPERLQVLKYLVMSSILHESKIDPFDSQEAKPYKSDPEIVAMTNLVMAFRNNEIKDFERILKIHRESLMGDPFIRGFMDDLLRTMRTQVVLKAIAPYTRITLPYVSQELNGIPEQEVEDLLVSLILDGKVDGRIDQARPSSVNRVLLCGEAAAGVGAEVSHGGEHGLRGGVRANADRAYSAVERWTEALQQLHGIVASKVKKR
ncbi:unnamed protein product, partial [Discosporangium mesarthrocarpum]